MDIPPLKTKLYIPPTPPALASHPHLIDWLGTGLLLVILVLLAIACGGPAFLRTRIHADFTDVQIPSAALPSAALPSAALGTSGTSGTGETGGADKAGPSAPLSQDGGSRRASLEEDVNFERISLEQGLSQSVVFCILQDSKGFMWFGTEDGLNKYDGYDFTVYKPIPGDPNSLSQNHIGAIYEDSSGALWVGTVGGGLNKLAPSTSDVPFASGQALGDAEEFNRLEERFTRYQYNPLNPHSLSSNYVRAIYQDREGVLWVGTEGGGLNRLDREQEGFLHYQANKTPYSLSSNTVWAIYQDREGTLWIGTENGLNRFDPQKEQFIHYYADPEDPDSLSNNSVRSIYEDQSGALWIGTAGGGLNKLVLPVPPVPSVAEGSRVEGSEAEGLDRSTGRFTRYPVSLYDPHSLSNSVVWTIYQDREGMLWIGTDNGLNRFDPQEGRFVQYHSNFTDPNSLSNNSIRSIYEDRSGVLWIGTYGGGVNKFDRSTERFAHYQAGSRDPYRLSSSAIRAIYEDQSGLLWIGTHGGGLNRIDREKGQVTFYRASPNDPYSLSHNVIRAIHEDRLGALWIGTEGGGLNRLALSDRSTERFTRYQNDPNDPHSLSDNIVMSIYEDREGVLWIGTRNGGLNRLALSGRSSELTEGEAEGSDSPTGRFIRYKNDSFNPFSLSSNYVRVIYEDREGMLWIGTGGGGLNKLYRGRGQFIRYLADPRDPNSLSDNNILSIYEDQSGTLWIGTHGGGLNKFDKKETFTHYREQDGLPNDVVYGISEDEQGNLWLSTNKGLSKFNPQTETFTNYDVNDGLQSNEFNGGAYYKSRSGEMFFGGINGLTAFYPDDIQDNPYIPPIVLTSLTQGGGDVDVGRPLESVREVVFQWPNNFFEFEFAALSFSQPEKNQYAYMLEGLDKDWYKAGTKRFGRYTGIPPGKYTLRLKGSNNDRVWNEEGISVTITIVPPFWATWWFRGIVALALVGSAIGGYRLRIRGIEARSRELEDRVEQRTIELRREIEQRLQVEEALRQSETEKAVAAERSRLARDLHDVVTQTLFSASLVAEALPTSWEKDREEGRQLLKELRQLTQGALAEMRTMLLELRPAALTETNLGDLLHQLAEAATGREGVPVTVTVDGYDTLPCDVHITLYRIAQEALNNITKHARASQVTVSLGCSSQGVRVELRISDDGRGFDPNNIPPDRLGLGIMRERAQAIGALLTIESQPGQGTQITVVWEKGKSL